MGAANDPPLTADQVRSEDDEKSYFGSDNDVSIRFDSSQDYLVFENEDTGEVWVFDSNGELAASGYQLDDNSTLDFGTDNDYRLYFDPDQGTNGAFVVEDSANQDVEMKFLLGGGIEYAGQTVETKLNEGEDFFKLVDAATSDAMRYSFNGAGELVARIHDESAGVNRNIFKIVPGTGEFVFTSAALILAQDDVSAKLGSDGDVGVRYSSGDDDIRWSDEANGADRMALDRTSGNLTIEGTISESTGLSP